MSILLPRGARDRALASLKDFFRITLYPRLTPPQAEEIHKHLTNVATNTKQLEVSVGIAASDLTGRVVINIVLDLVEGANGPVAN